MHDELLKHKGMIYTLATEAAERYHGRTEDYVGMVTQIMAAAIRNYDPSLGFTFSTYAYRCVRLKLKQYTKQDAGWKKVGKQERGVRQEYRAPHESLDAIEDWQERFPAPDAIVEPEAPESAIRDSAAILALAGEYLGRQHVVILKGVMAGKTLRGISREIGIGEWIARRMVENVRRLVGGANPKRRTKILAKALGARGESEGQAA